VLCSIVVTALVPIACSDDHITDAVIVANRTNEVLHFDIVLVDGSRFPLTKSAKAGESVRVLDGSQLSEGAGIMRNRCTVGELRALRVDGSVVSRIPPPICAPIEVVIP
jgi:hypothetical protein